MQSPTQARSPLDKPRLHRATRLFIVLSDAWLHRSGRSLHGEQTIEARLLAAVEAVESAATTHRAIAHRVTRGNLVNRIAHLLRWHTERRTDRRARPRPGFWTTPPVHFHPNLTGDEALAARIADELEAVRGRVDDALDRTLAANPVTPARILGLWHGAQAKMTGAARSRPPVDAYIKDRNGPVSAAAALIAELCDESLDTLIRQHRTTGHRHRKPDPPAGGDSGFFFGATGAPGWTPLHFLADALGLRWIQRAFLGASSAGPLLADALDGGAGWTPPPAEAHHPTLDHFAAIPITELEALIHDRRANDKPLAATLLTARLRRLNQSGCLDELMADLLQALNQQELPLESLVQLWTELLPWDRTTVLAARIDEAAIASPHELTWRPGTTPDPETHHHMDGHWYELRRPIHHDGSALDWQTPTRVWHPGPALAPLLLRTPILKPDE